MTTINQEVYRLRAIEKNYLLNKIKIPALRGVDLTIRKQERVALIGPSGSGKSTLLHILGTVDKPTRGDVLFNQRNVTELNDAALAEIRSNEIGFIFQNYNLIPVLSVFENVEYPLRIRKIALTNEIKARIMGLLEEVGLAEYAKRKPNELSGGQRQRVAIARALVINPEVVLADEPTANLDSVTSKKILELITSLSQKYQSTVVYCTHDNQVYDYVGRKLFLKDGNIEKEEF